MKFHARERSMMPVVTGGFQQSREEDTPGRDHQ